MKVAIYARVSTSEQSTDMQVNDLQRFAEARGWETQLYQEVASGRNERRPVLGQLLAEARKRRFDAVLVWRLDSISVATQENLDLPESEE